MAQKVKNLPAMQETQVQSLGQEDLLEKKTATHASILARRISFWAFPGGTSGKEPACQYRRCKTQEFNPWVGKIPWKRA